jgi:hypothetical protein
MKLLAKGIAMEVAIVFLPAHQWKLRWHASLSRVVYADFAIQ